jgi:branched-chain amino acid transport system ATP-binding protein
MKNRVLHVANVSKQFGGLRALTDVNLEVVEGEIHAIIGPNGAGKSTLLNVCVGRIRPDHGHVVFAGEKLDGHKPHQINQLGVSRVFQTPEIFANLSLLENVMIAAFAKHDGAYTFNPLQKLANRFEVKDSAENALVDLGLGAMHNAEAGSLSRGDKRRLELAMCLVQQPKLLLLDEPTAGMSRHDTNRTVDLLKEIKERGMTKVIIEHDMHVVFSLADRISVLAQGRIIASGTPDEVRGNPKVQEAYLGGTA